ncbi:aldo/keto reductase [Aquimarina latercula]|uniref:aldo/keto reductase n=1 Tax=Aquimarina latercula TaxID=987 RepID=UPI0004112A24|nr:aldo/keto reductase [Aquimarina latercula]
MISLNEISRLGIGTYRMSLKNIEHWKALEYAIDNGINLIDTASNYSNGLSEKLIGNLFEKRKDISSKSFIITKAGYIGGVNTQYFHEVKSKNQLNYLETGKNSYYSIDPKYLLSQIETSLKRLGRDYIDCFMLHSVERYFLDLNKEPQIYDDIVSAIEFLNTLVQKGIIRYLGISSNTFALPENNKFVDLQKIMDLLTEKKVDGNLKFIQFPYNLNETDASQKKFNTKSLLELIHKNKMISVTNRPLNTTFNNTVVRLATYDEEIKKLNPNIEEKLFRNFIDVLQIQLNKISKEKSYIFSFAPIKFFVENRKIIANPEALDVAINQHLIPFINVLYQEKIDKPVLILLNELRTHWYTYTKKQLTENALRLKNDLINRKIISANTTKPLTEIALDYYFNKSGINHVLVGMKNIKYIDQLRKINES